ncbi:endonuclease domain-containing protein [Microbacterium sp. MAHUQ-60]|uniref:endonuclease domain-containing protein n=1 Tax=unclassified Microbacterium TaxID=2609290 RepID=UPI00360E6967
MRHRIPLPVSLGQQFAVRTADAVGVGRWRRDTPDLHRPFHGIRSASPPRTFAEQLDCHRPRLKAHHRHVGRTAARLWGLPYPKAWSAREPVEVAVPLDRTPPKTEGVRGRRLTLDRAQTWKVDGMPVVDPVAALFTCADALTVGEAVVMIDALLTSASDYPDRRPDLPPVSAAEISERLRMWRTFPGCRTIRAALPLARANVESPKETETRLLIMDAGLPEPAVQHEVFDRRRFIARVDLAYPELKIAIEYEGDGHRTSREQWRRDIQRQRDLEDRGWIVIRLTQQDLGSASGAFLSRVRRAILARTAA